MAKQHYSKEELYGIYSYMMSRLPQFNFILTYGSLLGCIREGDFIEGDDDIDVFLPFKDREKYIFAIKRLQLPIIIEDVGFVQINVQNIGPFDVYFYEDRGTHLYTRWNNISMTKADILPPKKVSFKGFMIHIPRNSEKFLADCYGDNWRIPIAKEDYTWESITKLKHS